MPVLETKQLHKFSANSIFKRIWKKMKSSRNAYIFLLPAIIAMLALVFYPLVKGIMYSFTNMNQYNMGSVYQAATYKFVGLQNYKDILAINGSPFWAVLKQTFIWTFVNVFLHFTLGLGLAMLLNKKIRGRAIYRVLLLVPWAVPSVISAFAWRWMFNTEYGFFNLALKAMHMPTFDWLSDPKYAMIAAIATNVWLGFPFMMITMLGGLQSIPKDVYEAAMVDGANRIQQFFYVTLPLLKSVAFTATLLGVIWTFNMFNVIYLLTRGGPYNSTDILVTYAYIEAFDKWNFGTSATYGVIILSILIVFSSFYSRLINFSGEKVY